MELVINGNNVFRNGFVSEFEGGDAVLSRDLITFEGQTDDVYHEVTELDRLDLLAYRYYKDRSEDASKYWWIIADANNIENPLDLESFLGTSILIPNLLTALLKIQNT